LLRSSGLTPAAAHRRATLAYAAYLGHAQLVLSVPGVLPQNTRGRRALITELSTSYCPDPRSDVIFPHIQPVRPPPQEDPPGRRSSPQIRLADGNVVRP